MSGHVEESARSIAELYAQHDQEGTTGQKAIVRFVEQFGRGRAALSIAFFIVAWILANALLQRGGREAFDPPPFQYLQGIVTVSALLMTVLILVSQRHENRLAESRAQLLLHLTLVTEQKVAKTIELIEHLRRDHPGVVDRSDPQAVAMAQPTDALAGLNMIRDAHDQLAAQRDEPTP